MKKILTVLGARPQFIKAATVSRALQTHPAHNLEEVIIHTGQHYDPNMSDIFFQEMQIPAPRYHLGIKGASHGAMTGEMLTAIETHIQQEKPDLVLVYGDTNSTLAGALAAAKLHVPIAHIEAGMRAFNKHIPEEINRVITDHISTYFFCTTKEPAQNLRQEGIKEHIYVVGDVMYDAVLFYNNIMQPSAKVNAIPRNFYLVTIHRQENTDNEANLRAIFAALETLSAKKDIVFPIHPRTKKYLKQYNIQVPSRITLIDPVGYFDMLALLEKSSLVLTDSGGVQKEAYYFNKPSIILRDQTEWKELVEHGIAKVTGANIPSILEAVATFEGMTSFPKNLYGDGSAAEKIVQILVKSI
jgi:UDP-GlcNAc3NAcA epimerase